jgi:hypothetical protein
MGHSVFCMIAEGHMGVREKIYGEIWHTHSVNGDTLFVTNVSIVHHEQILSTLSL